MVIKRIKFKTPANCYFCQSKIDPSYKDERALASYITDRGKIQGRERNGLCARHQRRLAIAVKRARHLGIFPFKVAI